MTSATGLMTVGELLRRSRSRLTARMAEVQQALRRIDESEARQVAPADWYDVCA